ncbi:hypothetical protein MMC07_002324 [Pseudocyphellaria aurata]|nr:hypothetical protein [Pseudocyphellaria aurata]
MASARQDSPGAYHADSSDSVELLEQGQRKAIGNPKSKAFNPREQTWRLFREQGGRLAMTVVVMALIVVALKVFESQGNVSRFGKRTFNFVITGLSLLLGLGFFDAFKDMAKVLRWRILANHDFSLRETDLILGADSLMTLTTLMRESKKKPRILIVCALWIALNIAAQAIIGVIGLNYSMENGVDSTGIVTQNGKVNVSSIDCYYVNGQCIKYSGPVKSEEERLEKEKSQIVAQVLAHSYGENISGGLSCPYTEEKDIQTAPQNCTYFSHKNGREFATRYAEYNPEDLAHAYPFFTDRIVKASAGECSSYKPIGNGEGNSGNDGKSDLWVWKIIKDSTHNETLEIPKREAALDATTFFYYGTSAPPDATVQSCGDRCMWLYAWRSAGPQTKRTAAIFKCPISVSEVTHANHDWHKLDDDIARYAAASIALTGRNAPDWQQYRLYPFGVFDPNLCSQSRSSPWEVNNLSAPEVGALMSKFAIGSLATMARLNPQSSRPGTLPILGFRLSVEWDHIIILAVCIVAVHCILVGLMLWIASSVVVAHDSNLCMARLLEELVERLRGKGSLLNEKEIVTAIQGQGPRLRVTYGTGTMEGQRVLRLGDKTEVEQVGKWKAFPKGVYI